MQCQNLLNLQQVHSQSEILAEEVVENGHDSEKGKIMINNSKLGNRGVSLLITIVPLFEIKELLLWDNMIGDCGVKILAKAHWPSLKSLRLAENNITGKGVKSLVNGAFCNISELSLYKNALGNEGIKQLVKGQWKSLRTILLNNCQISNEAAIWLTFGNWKSLSSMNLGSNCISQAGSLCLLNINKQHNSPFSVLLFCNKFRPSVSKLLKTATPQNWKISA